MNFIARSLQLLGLVIVPMALIVGLMEQHNAMTRELTILFLGAGIFFIGYLLESSDSE